MSETIAQSIAAVAEELGATFDQTWANSGGAGFRLTMQDDPRVQIHANVNNLLQAKFSPIYPRDSSGQPPYIYSRTEQEQKAFDNAPDQVGVTLTRPVQQVASSLKSRLIDRMRPVVEIYCDRIAKSKALAETVETRALAFETFVLGSEEKARESIERIKGRERDCYNIPLSHYHDGFECSLTTSGISQFKVTKTLTDEQAKQLATLIKSFNLQ